MQMPDVLKHQDMKAVWGTHKWQVLFLSDWTCA